MSHQALVRLPSASLTAVPPRDGKAVSIWGPAQAGVSAIAQNPLIDDHDFSGDNYTLDAPSSAAGITVAIPDTVIARWRGEIESLSAEQRQLFLKELPEGGLQKYVDAIGDLIGDKLQKSQSLRAGRWIAPLVQLVDMSRPFVDALNSVYPPAGMILGGVTCVLSMSKKFVDYQEAVLDFLVMMCKNLNVIDRYKEGFQTEDMQLALIDVYGDIIQFCARASKPFLDSKGKSRMTAVSFFKSQIKSFKEEFGDLERNLATHLEVFDRTAILALGQMSAHLQQTQLMGLKMQVRSHEADKRQRSEEEERRAKALAKEQDEIRRQMLKWISTTDFRGVQDDKLDNTLAGTAQWLLEDDRFKNWKLHSQPNLIYLHGKAGSGKSHLAARLIRDVDLWCREQNASLAKVETQLAREQNDNATPAKTDIKQLSREQNANTSLAKTENQSSREQFPSTTKLEKQHKYAMAYVYCGANMTQTSGHKNLGRAPEARSGAAAILSSILKQLYSFLPRDQDVGFLKDLHLENQSSNPSIEDVRESIRLIVAKFARAFIVVDGLDECSGFKDLEFENLCTFISSLAASDTTSSPASVIIFSRPGYPTIEDVLGDASRIQVDVGANQADIDIFIAERTKNLTSNSSTLQDIKTTLSEDAEGMFLWVSLVIDSIKKERSDKRRKAAARNMPRGLAGAYSVALDRVMAQDESVKDVALKTLLWIANSERPLSEAELYEALSIEPGMAELDDEARIDRNFSLTEDCADLVVFRDGQYSLLHVSLKEYLTHPPLKPSEEPFAEYWVKQSKSQSILAELCLTYLMFDAFREQRIETGEDTKTLLEDYPLLEYAAGHWGKHVANVSFTEKDKTEKDKIMTLTRDFLDDRHLLQLWGQVISDTVGGIQRTGLQPLHLMSFFGLTELLQHFDPAELQLQLDSREEDGQFPIGLAFSQRQKGMADWLVTQYGSPTTKAYVLLSSRQPLVCLAARNNWADVIPRLLSMGLNCNEWAILPRQGRLTPLQEAVFFGSDEAALSLIEAGASLDLVNNFGETALIMAISRQRLGIVDVLLDRGANVLVYDNNGNSALTNAIRQDLLELVTKILRRGAEEGTQLNTRTSLQVAANFGSHAVIDVLLEHGADLECKNRDGLSPLAIAAFNGHLDVVKILLSRGAQLTSRNARKETIFHHLFSAPLSKRLDVLEWLLEHGEVDAKLDPLNPLDPVEIEDGLPAASVTITLALLISPDQDGRLPLYKAASVGDARALRILLDTPLGGQMIRRHGNDCLRSTLQKGDLDCSTVLFDACRAVLSPFPLPGERLMVYAAQSGKAELIPLVLRNGGSPVAGDEQSRTPLHIEAFWGYVDFIRLLTEQVPGLDYHSKDEYGQTPLHRAVNGGELEATELLLPQYTVNDDLGDIDGDWPLHVAAEHEELDCLKLLLRFDPKSVNRPNNDGDTALHCAARNGHSSVVECLLGTAGANVNATDNDGYTALHRAVIASRSNMALLLISRGHLLAAIAADKEGGTALHLAAERGNEAVVRELLDCGCKPHPEDVFGRTPFWLAVNYQQREVVDLYVSRGLDEVAMRHGPRRNCALAAARCGNLDLWRKFVSISETLISGVDPEGDDGLCLAASNGHTHMLEDMLAMGIDINGRSDYGGTALIMAAMEGSIDTVRYLCQNGADVDAQNMHGLTALHWAALGGFEECQRVLIEAGADQEIRDGLGILARDYKPCAPVNIRSPGPEHGIYDTRVMASATTREFILLTIERIRAETPAPPKEGEERLAWERKRRVELGALLRALGLFRDLEYLPLVELSMMHLADWVCCDRCGYSLHDGPGWYRCIHCGERVCNRCYYLPFFDHVAALEQLERMEIDTVAVRKVLRSVALQGHRMLLEVFNAHRALWDWVRKRAEACSARKSRNDEDGLKICLEDLPGWELMSILSQLGDEFGNTGRSANADSSVVDLAVKLNDRLRDLFRDHSPDKEVAPLNFESHRLVNVTPLNKLTDDKKAMLGPENELTEPFLRSLEEKYKSIEQADMLIRLNGNSNEAMLLYTGYDAGKQKGEIMPPASDTEEEEAGGEEMHVAADRQIEFLIGAIQHDLMFQWSLVTPGKKGKAQEEQELILETTWQLAQAIAYHEVRMPSLADLTAAGPTRSYWRKGNEPSNSDASSLLSDSGSDL